MIPSRQVVTLLAKFEPETAGASSSTMGRHLKVDAEEALRAANSKFERRFRVMETLARERGLALEGLSAETWEHLWQEAKKCEVRD